MIIRHNGKEYEITNWPAFRSQVLWLLGEGIVNEVQSQAQSFGLFQTGRYIRGFNHFVDDTGFLHIDNDVEYAAYLEYGTLSYFDLFGLDDFPESEDVIKKKEMSRATRDAMPKGMMPFAPIRRVIYSQEMMNKIIKRQFG